MSFGLILVHLGVGAGWLGGMRYSLFVVQPRFARVLPDPARAEELYRELGRRQPVAGDRAHRGAGGQRSRPAVRPEWTLVRLVGRDRGEGAAAGRGVGAVLVGVVAGLAAAGVRAAGGTAGGAGAGSAGWRWRWRGWSGSRSCSASRASPRAPA